MSKISDAPALYFFKKFRAGEAGYYEGRPRGAVAVYHDSKLYLYHYPTGISRKEFKLSLQAVFCKDGERLRGAWPEYTVD